MRTEVQKFRGEEEEERKREEEEEKKRKEEEEKKKEEERKREEEKKKEEARKREEEKEKEKERKKEETRKKEEEKMKKKEIERKKREEKKREASREKEKKEKGKEDEKEVRKEVEREKRKVRRKEREKDEGDEDEEKVANSSIEKSKTSVKPSRSNSIVSISTAIPNTSATSPRKSQRRIFLAATLLDAKQKKTLVDFKNQFGVRVTADFPSTVTHLVTKAEADKRATRSLKYMKALLTHKWILTFDWITECLKAGSILPEEPFEVIGTNKQSDESLAIPKFSRTKKKKIFAGINFYFEGKFKSTDFPSLEELKDLVTDGGGNVFDNNLKLTSAIRKKDKVVIIKDEPVDKDKSTPGAMVIGCADLLTLVTSYSIEGLFS